MPLLDYITIYFWVSLNRKGDFFKAHTHPNGNFTNVFFLHLPNKNLSTKLKAQDDVEINIDLDEGDILTIPAYLKHESPLISQDNEKYILSFNSSITTWYQEIVEIINR